MPVDNHLSVSLAPSLVQGRALTAVAALLLLVGCASTSQAVSDPVAWWHDLEGGRIAQERPAPPRADAPYPNLAAVPSVPTTTDAATRAQITSRLNADRANAAYGAAIDPVKPITPPRPQVPDADQASASMPAANAAPNTRSASAAPKVIPPAAAGAPKVIPADTAMPSMPNAPPRPPNLPGVARSTIAVPPRPTPPPAPVAPAVVEPGAPVRVAFPDASAAVPQESQNALKSLAGRRQTAGITVTGYGEAASSDPTAQSAALGLAWARAQSMMGVLQASGVPPAALTISAQAMGHGGVAMIAP